MAKAPVLGNDPFLRGAAIRPPEPVLVPEPESKAPVPEPQQAAPKPKPQKPARKPRAARKPKPSRVFEGELIDEIPRLPPATIAPQAPAPVPGWFEQARAAGTSLAGKAMESILASAFAQRAVQSVLANSVTQLAMRLLPPAVNATRGAISSMVSGEAGRSLVATAVEASAAIKQAAMKSEPSLSEVDAFGEDPTVISRAEPLLDFLHDRWFRVHVLEPERLPRGACLLVCNHSGVLPLDGLMIRTVLRRDCHRPDARWLVEDALFHAPIVGTLLNRLGAVRACPENASRLLEEGVSLAVFPEGLLGTSKTVGRRYQLQRFGRGGFVKLALRAKVPIVPVAIVGAEEASPLLAKIPFKALGLQYLPLTPLVPLPTRWTVSFLEPISLKGCSPRDAEDPSEVARLTGETRDAIQRELVRLVKERQSLLAG